MNIIPNVYQAAYMEGLNKKNNAGVGLFGQKTITVKEHKRGIREAVSLTLSQFNPYTVETKKFVPKIKIDLTGGHRAKFSYDDNNFDEEYKNIINSSVQIGPINTLKDREKIKERGTIYSLPTRKAVVELFGKKKNINHYFSEDENKDLKINESAITKFLPKEGSSFTLNNSSTEFILGRRAKAKNIYTSIKKVDLFNLDKN